MKSQQAHDSEQPKLVCPGDLATLLSSGKTVRNSRTARYVIPGPDKLPLGRPRIVTLVPGRRSVATHETWPPRSVRSRHETTIQKVCLPYRE